MPPSRQRTAGDRLLLIVQYGLATVILAALLLQLSTLYGAIFGPKEYRLWMIGVIALSAPILVATALGLLTLSLWPLRGVRGKTRTTFRFLGTVALIIQGAVFLLG